MNEKIEKYRRFLRDDLRLETDFSRTDQNQGIKPPPIEKPFSEDSIRIPLPGSKEWGFEYNPDILSAIRRRKSRRKFLDEALKLQELAFFLWATTGVRKKLGGTILRNVPSAGNRHAIETYLCILNIEGLQPGIYRYLPLEHELLLEKQEDDREKFSEKIGIATLGQSFIGRAPAVFVWAAIPYRMEWRYGKASHKVIAIDAGHICQNLYIACEAVGAGTCAIAAYNQELIDGLIGIDGKDEFVVYLAPVGKI
ncbi:SagB/ThcOx family dehydrogenase [Actinomycetota bacterium]